jgi:ribosomal protein S18 acetylase RimI-like enzyme
MARCETVIVELVPSRTEHRLVLEVFLRDWNALRVARRGVLVDSLDHPAVLAWSEGELTGVATYVVDGDGCELLTLHAATRLMGVGSALLAAVQDIARDAGCRRLWVVTTNDNLEALRCYQRRGFRLVLIRSGAVDRSREMLKPEIPRTGAYDIPLRDELELEMSLTWAGRVRREPRALLAQVLLWVHEHCWAARASSGRL